MFLNRHASVANGWHNWGTDLGTANLRKNCKNFCMVADSKHFNTFASAIQTKAYENGKLYAFKIIFYKKKFIVIQLKFRASLAVAHGYLHRGSVWFKPIYNYKDCEFPQSQMPENIKTFKQLTIKFEKK